MSEKGSLNLGKKTKHKSSLEARIQNLETRLTSFVPRTHCEARVVEQELRLADLEAKMLELTREAASLEEKVRRLETQTSEAQVST